MNRLPFGGSSKSYPMLELSNQMYCVLMACSNKKEINDNIPSLSYFLRLFLN